MNNSTNMAYGAEKIDKAIANIFNKIEESSCNADKRHYSLDDGQTKTHVEYRSVSEMCKDVSALLALKHELYGNAVHEQQD